MTALRPERRHCDLRSTFELIQLPDRFLRRRRAGHIATNNPFNLSFAPSKNFRDDANRQSRDIEFSRCGPSQVMEMQILVGKASVFLRCVE